MNHWTVNDVSLWLEENGLQRLVDRFRSKVKLFRARRRENSRSDEDVDGRALLELRSEEIEQLLTINDKRGFVVRPSNRIRNEFVVLLDRTRRENRKDKFDREFVSRRRKFRFVFVSFSFDLPLSLTDLSEKKVRRIE